MAEPNDDFFVETLNAGMVDGTLAISSDSDYDESDGLEDGSKSLFVLFSSKLTPQRREEVLGPVTSTPCARSLTPKGRKTLGRKEINIDVHNGVALRPIKISTSLGHLALTEKVAASMNKPYNLVELGYEAPWSSKMNNKKCRAYISNEAELDNFWLSYVRHVKAQKGKKGKNAEVTVDGIVIYNMLDLAQASNNSLIDLVYTDSIRIQRRWQATRRRLREASRRRPEIWYWPLGILRKQRSSTRRHLSKQA